MKNINFRRNAVNQGIYATLITFNVSIIGMVALFAQRGLVAGILTMGQVLIFAPPAVFAYLTAKSDKTDRQQALQSSVIIGVITALPLVALIWLNQVFNLRSIFINVSPTLMEVLTFGQEPVLGSLLLTAAMILVSLAAVLLHSLPDEIENALISGILTTLVIGLFSEILIERIRNFFGSGITRAIFASKAFRVLPATILFVLITGLSYWRESRPKSDGEKKPLLSMTKENGQINWVSTAIVSAFFLVLPFLMGTYLSEVLNNVGIFVLMGLGLNIVVGFAGLLDLGYVAFFAIGAYVMALLTSTGDLGIAQMSFWAALPICVAVSTLFGIMLGIPVLRMRGDYLAIVTLGFGEIIRILALSDMLKPFIGGAQGILRIPKPNILGEDLFRPEQLYFVILAGVLLVAFFSKRLRDSRLGRQWMAMREDETVAEAMGINLVNTKILAFAIGAAFSGLGGAIFASKLTSIFPHSFKLEVSINILSLIIVGGIGSLPGVVVGALILVGLPELLREFAEYRLLMYGALLIVMMLARPEGFWPAEVFKRELHAGEQENIEAGG